MLRLGAGVRLTLSTVLLAASMAGATVTFEVTTLSHITAGSGGATTQGQRYTYHLNDIVLHRNQELNIRFDPLVFASLSNPAAEPGFSLLLFQPNEPLGAFGDFSALALYDRSSPVASFSVEFTLIGPGVPGPQPYFINQFDDNGRFTTMVSGMTSPALEAEVPEPGTLAICGLALLALGALRRRRR